MNKLIFALLLILLTPKFNLLAQQKMNTSDCILAEEQYEGRDIYKFVDAMPQYPGGLDSLMGFIFKNIQIPKEEVGELAGKVITQFIVDTNGVLLDKIILRGFSNGSNKAVLNVLDKMPSWLPGKCNGHSVPVVFILPINITLQ